MIGEVWENAEVWLKGDMFDSVMNYDFRKHCRDFFGMRRTMADEFAWNMTDMFLRYPAQVSRGQLNLLDSHDVPRFYSLCGEDDECFRAAFLYLCMAPGVPSVFYGDEKRIAGIREEEYRRAMPWAQACKAETDFVRNVIEIRQRWIEPDDDYRVIQADQRSNLLVFERVGTHCVRVLIHMGADPADVQEYIEGTRILLQNGLEGSTIGYKGYAVAEVH